MLGGSTSRRTLLLLGLIANLLGSLGRALCPMVVD